MIFTSLEFCLFFVVVYSLILLIRRRSFQHGVLLVASSVFYGWWDWRFLGLMWFVIFGSYFGAMFIQRSPHRARWICFLTVGIELLLLAFFKYTYFVAESIHGLAGLLGFETSLPAFSIVLPVGISFYVFQAISYVVDVYRGDVKVERNPLRLGLYISFFPQLVAGPIVTASDFLPQLDSDRNVNSSMLLTGIREVVIGFIYKSVLADNISRISDAVYGDVGSYDNYSVFLGSIAFYSQIYFDFAGYSLMAIGLARMMGYTFSSNFDYPYSSTSVTEFWRRWHISLSSWLRKYLYFSLGGNRKGKTRTYVNLMVTMLLGGLWHGASWNFMIWGGLHGVALVFHKLWVRIVGSWNFPVFFLRVTLGWIVTQVFVWICWIPFRADSFEDVGLVLMSLLGLREDAGVKHIEISYWVVLMPVLLDAFLGRMLLHVSDGTRKRTIGRTGVIAIGLLIGVCIAVALTLIRLDVQPFVYFQF